MSRENEIDSTATYAQVRIEGQDADQVRVDAIMWEESSENDPSEFVEGRIISGDRMMAHFIRGDHIEFDTLEGQHIKAVTIQTSKLEVASGENLAPNSAFESGFAYWTIGDDFTLSGDHVVYGKQCAKLLMDDGNNDLKSDYCPIKQDADYCISFYYYIDGTVDDPLYFKLEQYDKNHVIGTTNTMKSSDFTTDAETRFEYQMTSFDGDAAYIKIYIQCTLDGGTTIAYFDAFQIEQIANTSQGAVIIKGRLL